MTPCPWCPQPEGHSGVCGSYPLPSPRRQAVEDAAIRLAKAIRDAEEWDETDEANHLDTDAADLRAQRAEERLLKGE